MTELLLRDKDKQQLLALLQQYLPDVSALAYGSRVNGRAHDGSDLDIVLRTQNQDPLDANNFSKFKEALENSSIPILVDVRDWARIPENFRTEIERKHVVLTG